MNCYLNHDGYVIIYNDKEFKIEYKDIHDISSFINKLMDDINSLENENNELIHCIAELQIENELFKNTEYLFD